MRTFLRRLVCGCAVVAVWCVGPYAARAEKALPPGFVRLLAVAPEIVQDIRYAGPRNFTGTAVAGYSAPLCILARPVAEALQRVQVALARDRMSLLVFDCYRPKRAVQAFVRWAERREGGEPVSFFFPRLMRSEIIPLGYVARASSHSRGVAVDLTIIRRSKVGAAAPGGSKPEPRPSCIGDAAGRLAPGELDMGTSFDCFDALSRTRTALIGNVARDNRELLLRVMAAEGFENYSKEWWHFTFPVQGFETAHDFDVE